MKRRFYSRYTSVIYRFGHRYFDGRLTSAGIGSGQEFFLLRIVDNPGISLLDLARTGQFDKGTTNRAVDKLCSCGYIEIRQDAYDKRRHLLYPTERGIELADFTRQMVQDWHGVLTKGMTEEECDQCERLLKRLSENARQYFETERVK